MDLQNHFIWTGPTLFCWPELNYKTTQNKTKTCFSTGDFSPVSAPGLLKADSTQPPLVSLGSSSSEQASTSKQQYSVEQQLYGASGSRDDIFSLGGTSYMTASKNCGSRTLGCVSSHTGKMHLTTTDYSSCLRLSALPLTKALPFLPSSGQPCWTANPKALETPISPCWRDPLHSHSQMKVGSPSSCPPQRQWTRLKSNFLLFWERGNIRTI